MEEKNYKAIIIGGGVAGLTAATKLMEKGIREILVIEASDRLGGRINTIEHDGAFIELGAQWIHGTKGNPIYELADRLNQVDRQTKTEFGDIMYYSTQDGKRVDEDFAETVNEKIEKIFDNLDYQIEKEVDERSDKSLISFLDQKFSRFIENYSVAVSELIKALYRARLNDERFDSACENLNEMSSLGWNEYVDFGGDGLTNLKSGYKKIVDYLVSQIPSDAIKLSEMVERIDWSQTNRDRRALVEVATFDAQKKTRHVYKADAVLCTVSLGYLKQAHNNLFVPHLPVEKVNAIDRLGFGCVDKIFLVFDKPVFAGKNGKDVQGLQILWRNDINFKLDEKTIRKCNLQNSNSRFYKILENFNIFPNHSNIMYTFVVGEDAIFIESLDDECLLDIFEELFKKCFPYLNLSRPIKLLRSKWNRSPFIRGSYSYIKMGSSKEDIQALSKPINNKLFFAGEHTNFKYYGTVHSAYVSGGLAGEKMSESI